MLFQEFDVSRHQNLCLTERKGRGEKRKREQANIKRASCFAFIFECSNSVDVQPCIVNQPDSSPSLVTPLSLSLSHRDLLTTTYCDPPYWLSYNTLYGANDKYELYMCSLSYVGCSAAGPSLCFAKRGRTQRQEANLLHNDNTNKYFQFRAVDLQRNKFPVQL